MALTVNHPALEERLARLERRERRAGAMIAVLGVLCAALAAIALLPLDQTLERERILLVDSQRRSRAELSTWQDGTVAFRLNDLNGRPRALWYVTPTGAIVMRMRDSLGHMRAQMGVDERGEPAISLGGPDGRTRTGMRRITPETPAAFFARDEGGGMVWTTP
jgi:hypothetical protein